MLPWLEPPQGFDATTFRGHYPLLASDIDLAAPLDNASGALALDIDATLAVTNGALGAPAIENIPTGKAFTGYPLGAADIALLAPLTSGTGGAVALSITAPLAVVSSALALDYAAPLSVTSGTLGVALTAPIVNTSGAVALAISAPLEVVSGALALDIDATLAVVSGALGIALNNANTWTVAQTFGAGATVASGEVLDLSGATVSGGPTFSAGLVANGPTGTSGGDGTPSLVLGIEGNLNGATSFSPTTGFGWLGWNLSGGDAEIDIIAESYASTGTGSALQVRTLTGSSAPYGISGILFGVGRGGIVSTSNNVLDDGTGIANIAGTSLNMTHFSASDTAQVGFYLDSNSSPNGSSSAQQYFWARSKPLDHSVSASAVDYALVVYDGTTYWMPIAFDYTNKVVGLANDTGWSVKTPSGTLAPSGMQEFSSSNTFTVPAGAHWVAIEAWAAGGSGAGGTAGGAAGGGAGYAFGFYGKANSLVPGTVLTVSVPAGPAGGGSDSNGTAGGSATVTWTGGSLTASGGGAGVSTTGGAGGGGVARIVQSGGDGASSGGDGGSGGGDGGAGGTGGGTTTTGGAGGFPGGGGGGGGGSSAGGAGASGLVIIYWG